MLAETTDEELIRLIDRYEEAVNYVFTCGPKRLGNAVVLCDLARVDLSHALRSRGDSAGRNGWIYTPTGKGDLYRYRAARHHAAHNGRRQRVEP